LLFYFLDNNTTVSTSTVNEKWTTDVSEFHITAGKLYLSPILDMHNREIISWNISKIPNYEQVDNILDITFHKYPNIEGLIFHSNQGWQYQMNQYHKTLHEHGIIQSMSRKGNCSDNCVMENFFGKMKNEMFYGHEYEFKTLDELEIKPYHVCKLQSPRNWVHFRKLMPFIYIG